MQTRVVTLGVSALAIAIIHCGTISPIDPGSRTPKVHRPSGMTCDSTRPPILPGMADGGGAPDSGIPDQCNVDADCTNGKNGRCDYNRIGKQCTYDTCTTDADCTSGGVCMCRMGATDTTNNHCAGSGQPGSCKVDSDCGPKGFCSPSFGSCGAYGGIQGYFCHTSSDTCVDDSDCQEGGVAGYCMFQVTAKKWECSYAFCAG
jgi:hypothetical protein